MANGKFQEWVDNELTQATIDGTEKLYVTKSSASRRTTIDAIIAWFISATNTLTNKTINGADNTLTVRLANDVTGNLPVTNLGSGTGASGTTYWRGDGTWATPSGGGGGGSWGSITGTLSNQTDLQTALDAKASSNIAVALRGVRIACASTSYLGFDQSPFSYLATFHGQDLQGTLNGGNSGQKAQDIADHFHTNVISQNPGIALIAAASNDFLGGVTTDAPAPGRDTIANAKYYTEAMIDAALAVPELNVAVINEPYRQLPQTGVNANIIYWNTVYLPALVASYNNPRLILIDAQSSVVNITTGVPDIAIITQVATGSAGSSTFTVPDATGITLGMCVHDGSNKLETTTLTKRVTGISGTTITFSGTIATGGIAENVYFYVDYYDNVHSSPVGSKKIGTAIYDALVAADWLPEFDSLKPLTSSTAAASVDNLISNALLQGAVSGGVGAGWSTNYSTPAVVADANFSGLVQRVTLVAGEAAGKFLLAPQANVVAMRGKDADISIMAEFTGFQPNGGIIDVRGWFDVSPQALSATFTNATAQPITYANVSIVDGLYVFSWSGKVPMSASNFQFTFTNQLAFPAGAATSATIKAGEAVVMNASNPTDDMRNSRPSTVVESFNASGYVISPHDGMVSIDASAGSISKALPSSAADLAIWRGNEITVVKRDSSGNTITVTGATGGSVVLSAQGDFATFATDGTNRWMVGKVYAGGGSSQWTTTGSDIYYDTGGVKIGAAAAPDVDAILDLQSTTKGFLPPRMTAAQMNAISTPPEFLTVAATDLSSLYTYIGFNWRSICTQYNVNTFFDAANIDFAEAAVNGASKVTLSAPASVGSDITVTLPDKAGTLALATRVVTLTDAATVTPNCDTTDIGLLLTLSQNTTLANPTGTPADGQKLAIRVKSTSARTWTFGSQFRGSTDTALPAATSGSSLTDYMGFQWNAADSKWDYIAKNFGF